MIEIQLAALPSQSFSIRRDDNLYNITIRETNGCMSATVVRNNITLLSDVRLVAQFPIIPYYYLESGNFIINTLDDDLPDWTKFGISQSLFYASESEIAGLRAGV
jgi:hypothetical protein